jgi:hypothetical protein
LISILGYSPQKIALQLQRQNDDGHSVEFSARFSFMR